VNPRSDDHDHFVETVMNTAVGYIPARMFGVSTPDVLHLSVTISFSAVIHADVQTNLGPPRSVFVSPQARRVQHSVSHGPLNSDDRTVVECWGQLFRTRARVVNTYSETGIHDPDFAGRSINPRHLRVVVAEAHRASVPSRAPAKRRTRGNVIQRQHARA